MSIKYKYFRKGAKIAETAEIRREKKRVTEKLHAIYMQVFL